jgi:hypothetical protein
MSNKQVQKNDYKKTVFISVSQEIIKKADEIYSKAGVKRSKLIAMAAEIGWPTILGRWGKVLQGEVD